MSPKAKQPSVPYLRTKLHRPLVSDGIVLRKRLHEALDRAKQTPLTLVSAPAGYGKSVLVSQWAASLQEPCAWLSLDAEDSDLRVFVGYLLAAVRTAIPDACPQTEELNGTPNPVPIPVLSACLVNELDAIDSPPFVLVLDDYHRIERSSDVNELLRFLVEHPPRGLQLVLITRSDPPLPLTSLRGGGSVTDVRLHELRFTEPETIELLESTTGIAIGEDALHHLQQELEGWAVGLRLVLIAVRQVEDPDAFLMSLHGGIPHTQDYLMREVLAGRSPEFRSCLLNASILDRFCPDAVDALCAAESTTEPPELDGGEFVRLLQEGNLFTIALDAQREWFRFHHLFQDLLQRQLKREASAEELAMLHLRASEWFESRGLITESIQHALEVDDAQSASDLVERHRYDEMNADRWYVIEKWLARLPAEIRLSKPGLLLMQAWIAYWRFELAKLVPIVEQVEALVDEKATKPRLLGELDFFKGQLAYWQGEAERATEQLERALSRLRGAGGIIEGNVEIMLALARCLSGRGEMAVELLERRVRTIDPAEDRLLAQLLGGLIFVHFTAGNLVAGRVNAEQIGPVSERAGMSNTAAWAPYFLAYTYFQSGELATGNRGLLRRDSAAVCSGAPSGYRFVHGACCRSAACPGQGGCRAGDETADQVRPGVERPRVSQPGPVLPSPAIRPAGGLGVGSTVGGVGPTGAGAAGSLHVAGGPGDHAGEGPDRDGLRAELEQGSRVAPDPPRALRSVAVHLPRHRSRGSAIRDPGEAGARGPGAGGSRRGRGPGGARGLDSPIRRGRPAGGRDATASGGVRWRGWIRSALACGVREQTRGGSYGGGAGPKRPVRSRRPDQPRTRHPRIAAAATAKQRNRGPSVHLGTHRERSPQAHLPEARREEPEAGGRARRRNGGPRAPLTRSSPPPSFPPCFPLDSGDSPAVVLHQTHQVNQKRRTEMMAPTRFLALAVCFGLTLCGSAAAEETKQNDAAALAKEVQNPLANLVVLPFQTNFNSGAGPYDRTFFNLNVQPVVPFPGKKWDIIARAIIPVNSVPQGETDSIFGIGDTNLSLFWTPAKRGSLTWGVGPAIVLPTASNPEALGSGKFSLGPTGIIFFSTGPWTMGGVASNAWSVAGDGDRDDVNLFYAQYFFNYNFGGGWAMGTSPILTANWEADSGNQWTIPWGLNVSKVMRFGNQPVNLLLGYYKNSEHPEGAADSQVRLQINFMYPTKKK